MTDKEKIIAEIEKRLEKCELVKKDACDFNANNLKLVCSQLKLAYQSLLDFINFLPEDPDLNWKDFIASFQKDIVCFCFFLLLLSNFPQGVGVCFAYLSNT